MRQSALAAFCNALIRASSNGRADTGTAIKQQAGN